MRYLPILICMVLLAFTTTSCDDEEKEVTVDFGFDMVISSDETSGTILCGAPFFSEGWAEGSVSELGALIKNESPWTITTCTPISETQVNMIVDGIIAGSEGTMTYEGDFTSDLATMTVSGAILITSGTGAFKGARGNATITSGTITGAFENPPFAVQSRLIGSGSLTYRK